MTAESLAYFTLGIILLLSVSAFFTPVRLALKAALRLACGFCGMVAAGLLTGLAGVGLSVNLWGTLLTAIFGVPGLLLTIFLQLSLT